MSINLQPCRSVASDERISRNLHASLEAAGFTSQRAAVQSALAEVLQDIQRTRLGSENIHIVGSYAEGWGNSLECLNGVTDLDSDIDVTVLQEDKTFHLDGFCQCSSVGNEGHLVTYEDGHVISVGSTSNPALSFFGSAMRPANDWVYAYKCCSYPRMRIFEQNFTTNISCKVLQSLQDVALSYPCHLVAAAPPGKGGQQLRISTNFLERKLLQSLTTTQGQVFILLKYLVKKVISTRVHGVKSYHVKTILFYLMEQEPKIWRPESLVGLARRGLQLMLRELRKESHPDHCMWHFFMRDARLYLRKGHSGKAQIAAAIEDTIGMLPLLALQLRKQLKQCSGTGIHMHFDPFAILPFLSPLAIPNHGNIEYHEIYDIVNIFMFRLIDEDCSSPGLLADVAEAAAGLPDCSRTVRSGLLVLAYLKFRLEDSAKRVLLDWRENSDAVRCVTFSPSTVPASISDTAELVWCQLRTKDLAWKFCLRTLACSRLEFLPERIRRYFPCRILYLDWYYMNFETLLRCLYLHLVDGNEAIARSWFEEALHRRDADPQELLMTLEFCEDRRTLAQLISRHRDAACMQAETRAKVWELMRCNPKLVKLSAQSCLEQAVAELCNSAAIHPDVCAQESE